MADTVALKEKKRFQSTARSGLLNALTMLTMAVLLVLTFNGCGKKAPPKPPEGEQLPPAVLDLNGRIDDGTLSLGWTVPAPTERNPVLASGFSVLVFKQRLGEPCPNCPPNFKRVGQLKVLGNLEVAAGNQSMHYRYPVEPGYRYTVIAVSIAEDGTAGPESNTLKIEY